MPHRGPDGIVPGDVLQRKSVRILPSLSQKRVAKSPKSSIQTGFDFITQPSHLGFQNPRLEFLSGFERLQVVAIVALDGPGFPARWVSIHASNCV
jgi:hypothetical protein